MIGNLFSSIALATFSSLLALGSGVKSKHLQADVISGNSWVNGAECNVYLQLSKSFHFNSVSTGSYFVYDFDGNEIDSDPLNANQGKSVDLFLSMLYDYFFEPSDANYICYGYSQITNSPIVINQVPFNICFRFCLPTNSINGIEFRCNRPFALFKGNYSGTSTIHAPSVANRQNAFGIYDGSYDDLYSDPYVIQSLDTSTEDYYPTRFVEYLFLFGGNDSSRPSDWYFDLDLDMQFISGGSEDFNAGFQQGYNQGRSDGYGQGYSDGVATANQGGFLSLFNAIADTPLRFLYGLFSFDLFGTSMLIIILSLLTGIVLFGIVKKFWK